MRAFAVIAALGAFALAYCFPAPVPCSLTEEINAATAAEKAGTDLGYIVTPHNYWCVRKDGQAWAEFNGWRVPADSG